MTTLLIVDDPAQNRCLLETLFQSQGYRTLSAENGAVALALARSEHLGLVVADILRSEMDGFELCRRMRQDEHLKAIPFLIYTATYTEPKDERFALSLGADRFILKPQEPEQLLTVIQEVLAEGMLHRNETLDESLASEMDYLRQHNAVLFHKLDKKMRDPGARLVLSDDSLPTYDGIRALADVRNTCPELPFIFVSGAMGEDMAVECMKIGATDYVLKSNLKRLSSAIRWAISELDTRLTLTEAARVAKVVLWHWNEAEDTWLFGHLVQDILGYSPGVLKSTPGFLKAQVHLEDLPRFVSSFELAKGRERMDFDCRILHGAGRWLWIRWTLAWTDGRCRGILQDITKLRATQEALIRNQRLETLGMMVGGITHDFTNLITAMNGAVELLSLSALTEAQQRRVGILARSCLRAMTFKEDLLRLARKGDAPGRIPMELNEVAQEAITMLSHALPKSMETLAELQEGLPPILAVPERLLQVLMNLGINARDAMGTHGRITLRTGIASLSEAEAAENNRPSGGYVFAEIEDTGPGIPPEVLPHVCDPFFTTKEKGKGTGLGLAMVRAIIQQHEGVFQLHSVPGAGARFRFLLPPIG